MLTSDVFARPEKSEFRRHIQALLYDSFRQAQGDQALQVHFIECYARRLRECGVPINPAIRAELTERIRARRLPRGHIPIPNVEQVRSQFEFWWLNTWDILLSVYSGDATRLPAAGQLTARMVSVGGTPEMSSYTPDEMRRLNDGFAPYRDGPDPARSAREIIHERFLPSLIRVESYFQGNGPRYAARPRTDGGDIHESRMLGHCRRAHFQAGRGTAEIIDHIYLEVSHRLSWLASHRPSDGTYVAYTELVRAYNRNHPGTPSADLHSDKP